MGAGGLIEIKRRLKSIQSTRRITSAMGLVATSKLRKCRRVLKESVEYSDISRSTIQSLVSVAKESECNDIFFSGNKSNDKLYIVITSDSGLCAGYNGNAVIYLESIIEDFKDEAKIILVGSKGVAHMKKLKLSTIAEYVDIKDIPSIKDVKNIYQKALKLFLDEEVSEVNVIYTNFESPVKQTVSIEKLLPISEAPLDNKETIVKPNIEVVFKSSIDGYLKGKLRMLMLSSRCSEESARMNSMDGATSNADDILNSLKLQYNRIRQAMITQEISEIVGGASAQK